jgi:hypothetical protein
MKTIRKKVIHTAGNDVSVGPFSRQGGRKAGGWEILGPRMELWPLACISAWGRWERYSLKLGGVTQHRVRKWIKTVYVPESTCHRETFPPQKSASKI